MYLAIPALLCLCVLLAITPAVLASPTASYTVSTNGAKVKAVNNTSKDVEFNDPDASTVIQQAIDALVQTGRGGKIFIREGVYSLTTQLVVGSGIQLLGNGESSELKLVAAGTQASMIKVKNGNDVTISSLRLNGDRSYQTQPVIGIQVTGNSSRVTIRDNHLLNIPHRAISASGSGTQRSILDNTVESTGEHSIVMFSNEGRIEGNTVTNGGGHGIWLARASQVRVSHNNVRANYRNGIELKKTSDFVVTGNIIAENGNIGIALFDGSQSGTVSNNQIARQGSNGVDCNQCRGVSISGNNSSFNGIASSFCLANTCEGNGILLYRSGDVVVTGNVVFNNDQNNRNRDGIRVASDSSGTIPATKIVITANHVYDNQPVKTQDWGIKFNNLGGLKITNQVVVLGNLFDGNEKGGLSTIGLASNPAAVIANNLGM